METKLVINELLAYVFDAKEYANNSDIVKTLDTFYCDDELQQAKDSLWDHYNEHLPNKVNHRKTLTGKTKTIEDIVKSVDTLTEHFSSEHKTS